MTENTEPVYAVTGEIVGFKVFIPVQNQEHDRIEALSAFQRLLNAFSPQFYKNGWDVEVEKILTELKTPRQKVPKYKVVEDKA